MISNKLIALPADQIEAGNRIGYIIDPDTGGDKTYTLNASATGSSPKTHALTNVPLTPDTAQLIDTKNPSLWHAALTQAATERGRPLPSLQDCIDVCAAIDIDDEVSVSIVADE